MIKNVIDPCAPDLTFEISPLSIVNPLDLTVPICVLRELSVLFQIDFDDLNNPINRYLLLDRLTRNNLGIKIPIKKEENIITVRSSEILNSDWDRIKLFLNPNVPWTSPVDICRSLEFILKFISYIPSDNIHRLCRLNLSDYPLGRPTPSHPETLLISILYQLCRYHNLNLNINISPSEIFEATASLHSSFNDENRSDLIIIKKRKDPPPNLFRDLTESIRLFSDLDTLRSRISVESATDSIALAAINCGLDISLFQSPSEEYNYLQRLNLVSRPSASRRTRNQLNRTNRISVNPELLTSGPNPYIPLDLKFRLRYLEDPERFFLRTSFNINFPPEFYNSADLTNQCLAEGYTDTDLLANDPYELLQATVLTDSFYLGGRWLGITNQETPIYSDNIDEIPSEEIIVYGVRDTNLVAFRCRELTDWFNSINNFINPLTVDNQLFEPRLIRKLRLLCQRVLPCDTFKSKEDKKNLLLIINKIEAANTEKNDKIQKLIKIYSSSDLEVKEKTQKVVLSLFDFSLALRGHNGWESISVPIEEAPERELATIEVRTTILLDKFEKWCEDLEEIGSLILEIPIMRYVGNEFIVSTDPKIGLTIRDKISIIREGEDAESESSCIRLSSNWLCTTAYRLMMALSIPTPFNINRLKSIW